MSFLQAKLFTDSKTAEALSDALLELGALSVSISDALAGTPDEQPIFGEPGEDLSQLWAQSMVYALFPADKNIEQDFLQPAADLCQVALPDYEVEMLPAQDWVRETQAQFSPIQISDKLWITPSWHTVDAPDALCLVLDPGLAFGTGSHPTTRLCLEWLSREITGGETVLDYGCGSGILAIAAVKLGAASALGTDIDPQALIASSDNAARNAVQQNIEFCPPEKLDSRTFDIVVANILANPLRLLAELLAHRVRAGGRIVLSGILDSQAEELSARYATWFEMDAPEFSEGWCRLSGVRKT